MEKGTTWIEPYFSQNNNTMVATYSAVFNVNDPETGRAVKTGAVSISISIDQINEIIKSVDLGPSGFGGLISKEGFYLYHPKAEYVTGRKTILDIAKLKNDNDRLVISERAAKGLGGIMDHVSTTTGRKSWLVYQPIPSTGWSLQNTFIKGDIPVNLNILRHQIVTLILSSVVLLIALSCLVFRVYKGETFNLWIVSIFVSVALICGIGFLWNTSLKYSSLENKGEKITDQSSLNDIKDKYINISIDRRTEEPVFIPTGIFIDSIKFVEANDVLITGYIWQKYSTPDHDDIPRGAVFTRAHVNKFGKPYILRENGFEISRWHFEAMFRQRLNHKKYPLERAKIEINMLHNDMNHNVVLTPDISSYKFISPSLLPGLDSDLTIPGWSINSSYFDLQLKDYSSTFGIKRTLSKENFPSLYFNIIITRNFINAFISNLTPIIVVAFLLFGLLAIIIRDEQVIKFMQAGTGRVLSICVAMFFVIVFSHIDIRRDIGAQEIFYLEYFYFIIYFAILGVSVNSILFSLSENVTLVQYKENLIAKLLYWPMLLGALFIVTVIIFY